MTTLISWEGYLYFIKNPENIYYIEIIYKTIKIFDIYVEKYQGTEYRKRTNNKLIAMFNRDS